MSDNERVRRNGDGVDDAGIALLRETVDRVAASLPQPRHARVTSPRAARGAPWRALAAALVIATAAVGAWLALGRWTPDTPSGSIVAESELKVELFRVRGRAVPATVLAPSGAGSVLVVPRLEERNLPRGPQGFVGIGGVR